MSNGFLSQEEIDALLNGAADTAADDVAATPEAPDLNAPGNETSTVASNVNDVEVVDQAVNAELPELSELEKDLLGEVGNISMGSAATALSKIINQEVNITTPVVTVTTLNNLKKSFTVPNIALEVEFISGILGENLLVMKISDAFVISSLMMGGDGSIAENTTELSEIELSAVSEAMNQMIGSAATSMATMFAREVGISPPISKIWDDATEPLTDALSGDEPIISVSFAMKIGELVDSNIMQILTMSTAKKIVAIMMGQETEVEDEHTYKEVEVPDDPEPKIKDKVQSDIGEATQEPPKVEVQKAAFQPLTAKHGVNISNNIELILDVPLEISVQLGKTKMNIKDILNLGIGSLIELDKLAEAPVEILVNGKKIAYGEVVVVDENFGVRISSIISGVERVKTLSK